MLINIKVTGGLNIESGHIDPKATGGWNIESGQIDPKATQGLKDKPCVKDPNWTLMRGDGEEIFRRNRHPNHRTPGGGRARADGSNCDNLSLLGAGGSHHQLQPARTQRDSRLHVYGDIPTGLPLDTRTAYFSLNATVGSGVFVGQRRGELKNVAPRGPTSGVDTERRPAHTQQGADTFMFRYE